MVVIDLLRAIVQETFWVLYEGGLFILIGFVIAGAVHVLLDPDRIVRYLGERSVKSAAIAALIGAPLPLCSCGVLPTALALRRKGASREATLSFLISTPETGVDSIAVTFAFFGPLMAVIRPVVAIITGIVAALLSLRRSPANYAEPDDTDALPGLHGHATATAGAAPPPDACAPAGSRGERLRWQARRAMRYAFRDLFDELGFWLAFAFIVTGIIAALAPPDLFSRFSPSPLATMLFMAALGVPLYVCASASTPLAAVFVAKGASVGAALVFLLAGPATNAATMGVVSRVFGRRFLAVYLGAIIGVALAAGLLVDALFPTLAANVRLGAPEGPEVLGLPKLVGAIAVAWLLAASLWRTGVRNGFRELAENAVAMRRWMTGLTVRAVLAHRGVQALIVLWLAAVALGGFTAIGIGERGLRQRLGALVGRPQPPGLAYAWPVVDRLTLVKVDEIRNRTVGFWIRDDDLTRIPVPEEALFVTADENVIDLRVDVQFQVADPVRYRLAVERPDDIVARLVRARLVEAMAGRPIDRVYTDERAEVENRLTTQVQRDADAIGLGVTILAVRLLDVQAPSDVHDAFRDVASAGEDRQRIVHQANEYAVQTVAMARAEAVRVLTDADAWAVTRTAKASAAAVAFAALAAEERRAPQLIRDRLYLETAERVLPGARKIIRSAAGAPQGYELWLRSDGAAAPVPPDGSAPPGSRPPVVPKPAGGTP